MRTLYNSRDMCNRSHGMPCTDHSCRGLQGRVEGLSNIRTTYTVQHDAAGSLRRNVMAVIGRRTSESAELSTAVTGLPKRPCVASKLSPCTAVRWEVESEDKTHPDATHLDVFACRALLSCRVVLILLVFAERLR